MEIAETLSRDDPIGLWIDDFAKSKDPRLAGKSKRERRNMAIAAYYGYTNRTESTKERVTPVSFEIFENQDLTILDQIEETASIPEELVDLLEQAGIEKQTFTVHYVKEGVSGKTRITKYSPSTIVSQYAKEGVDVKDITRNGVSVLEDAVSDGVVLEESCDLNEVSSSLISKARQKAHQKSLDHYASAVSHDKDIKFDNVRNRYTDNPDHPDNNKEAAKHMKLHQKYSNMYFNNASKEQAAKKREQSNFQKNKKPEPFDHKSMGDHIQKTHYNSNNRSKYIGDSVELGSEFKTFQEFFKESQENQE